MKCTRVVQARQSFLPDFTALKDYDYLVQEEVKNDVTNAGVLHRDDVDLVSPLQVAKASLPVAPRTGAQTASHFHDALTRTRGCPLNLA